MAEVIVDGAALFGAQGARTGGRHLAQLLACRRASGDEDGLDRPPQRLSAPDQEIARPRRGQAQNLSDLAVAEAVAKAEAECLPVLRLQGRSGCPHQSGGGVRDGDILGARGGRLEIRDRVEGQGHRGRAQMPAPRTMGNAVHPRSHQCGIAERRQAGPGLQEGLLDQILSGGTVPGEE